MATYARYIVLLVMLCGCGSGYELKPSPVTGQEVSPLPEEMTSSKLSVRFDPQAHEPAVITDRETDDSLTLVPESAFRLELDKLPSAAVPAELAGQRPSVIIDSRRCEIVDVDQKESADRGLVRSIVYRSPHGRIAVEYTLGADDHFFQKHICFTPAFSESYLLRRVCVQQYRFSKRPESLISFRHGRCMTHFVRRERMGFFFGVQVPLEVNLQDPAASIELCYDANYRYSSKEPYVAETVYWGVYRRTGTFAPPVPERIDECNNSTTPPDLGESAAMLAMVQRLTHPRPVAVSITYNWWDGGTSRNGYGTGATAADLAQDKQVLSLAKEQFGEFYTELLPWGGMFRDMSKLGPEAQEPPASPLQREMLDWARQEQINLGTWASMKAIMPWLGVHRYCPDHSPWFGQHGDVPYNCPANRQFMEWFTRLQVALIRRDGYAGFALDELLPHPRTGLPCSATGHDHLPGDASYGYFVARRDLLRTMRREFGPDFILSGFRPSMDAGIWDALYQDNMFTVSESFKHGGDEIRYRSRVRHFYHFVPSYMDQPFFRPDPSANVDVLMLSALAVSNRHIVYGLGHNEAERKRIRYWYDWARAHKDLMMRQTIFLPDWPGGGKCDSYVRLDAKGGGYAFVFNANDTPARTELPLDERCGLTAGKSYRLQRVFPESTESGISRDRFELTVPARQVLLLSIQPDSAGG